MSHYPFQDLVNTEHHRSPSTDVLICRARSCTGNTQPSFPAAFCSVWQKCHHCLCMGICHARDFSSKHVSKMREIYFLVCATSCTLVLISRVFDACHGCGVGWLQKSAFCSVKNVQAFEHLNSGVSLNSGIFWWFFKSLFHTQESEFYPVSIIIGYYLHLVRTVQSQKPLRRAPAAMTWDTKCV